MELFTSDHVSLWIVDRGVRATVCYHGTTLLVPPRGQWAARARCEQVRRALHTWIENRNIACEYLYMAIKHVKTTLISANVLFDINCWNRRGKFYCSLLLCLFRCLIQTLLHGHCSCSLMDADLCSFFNTVGHFELFTTVSKPVSECQVCVDTTVNVNNVLCGIVCVILYVLINSNISLSEYMVCSHWLGDTSHLWYILIYTKVNAIYQAITSVSN